MYTNRRAGLFVLSLVALTIALQSVDALAQTMPTYQDIQTSAGSSKDDTSREILSRLLGPFADNPFTPGQPSTLLGWLFFYFNAALFVIGSAFIGYHMMTAIATTAYEGEVLGKRMNGLWVPIRFTIGIFGMVPVFAGFSLAQAVMMLTVVLGIGMANLMSTEAINNLDKFQSIVPTPVLTAQANSAASQQVADTLFLMHVCTMASRDYSNWLTRNIRQVIDPPTITIDQNGVTSSGAGLDCGKIKLNSAAATRVNSDGWSWRNFTQGAANLVGLGGYRNTAVDYAAINAVAGPIRQAQGQALFDMSRRIQPIAQKWYDSARGDLDKDKIPSYPWGEIWAVVSAATEAEAAAIKAAMDSAKSTSAVKETAKKNMASGGWVSIGAWYATFAEANAALQSASSSTEVVISEPNVNGVDLPTHFRDIFKQLAIKKQQSETCILGTNDVNPTGNCSPGQNLILWVLNKMAQGTGGGEGASSTVNPVFFSKNVGDVLLNIAATLWSANKLAVDNQNATLLDKAKDKLGALTGGAGGVVATIFGKMGEVMVKLGTWAMVPAFVLGLMFGVYIPFIPFLTWFAALIAYFASVIEGLVAAQVWGFSHIEAEGEGMGQKAGRGYVFGLNLLLRPPLMIVGFFFGSAISVLLGTVFFQLFTPALANVQGDTMTGILIQFGALCVVMITIVSLVQSCFNLIFEVPDRVIGWLGGNTDAKIGREIGSEIKEQKRSAAKQVAGVAASAGGAAAST